VINVLGTNSLLCLSIAYPIVGLTVEDHEDSDNCMFRKRAVEPKAASGREQTLFDRA